MWARGEPAPDGGRASRGGAGGCRPVEATDRRGPGDRHRDGPRERALRGGQPRGASRRGGALRLRRRPRHRLVDTAGVTSRAPADDRGGARAGRGRLHQLQRAPRVVRAPGCARLVEVRARRRRAEVARLAPRSRLSREGRLPSPARSGGRARVRDGRGVLHPRVPRRRAPPAARRRAARRGRGGGARVPERRHPRGDRAGAARRRGAGARERDGRGRGAAARRLPPEHRVPAGPLRPGRRSRRARMAGVAGAEERLHRGTTHREPAASFRRVPARGGSRDVRRRGSVGPGRGRDHKTGPARARPGGSKVAPLPRAGPRRGRGPRCRPPQRALRSAGSRPAASIFTSTKRSSPSLPANVPSPAPPRAGMPSTAVRSRTGGTTR